MTRLPVTRGAGESGLRDVAAFLKRGSAGRRLGAESAGYEPGLRAWRNPWNRRNPESCAAGGKERTA